MSVSVERGQQFSEQHGEVRHGRSQVHESALERDLVAVSVEDDLSATLLDGDLAALAVDGDNRARSRSNRPGSGARRLLR